MVKYNKKRLFEMMGKLDSTFKPKLNEDAFNDAGEPMMSHSQFRDYSEPSEPEFDNKPPQQPQGIGNFRDIDWKTLHGIFIQNTEAFKQGKFSDGVTINDLTDYDGYLTPDELKHLDNWSLIYIDGQFVVIDDDEYLDYNTFFNKAQEIWDKEPKSDPIDNSSEAPYMRGREPMGEGNSNDKILINMFIASLPNDFPELVRSYSTDKNIGIDSAYYQFIGAFQEKFENDNAINFKLDDDELDELSTLMYGRFGDNAIEF